ncbi:hypothetical protein BOX15_Mlig024591g2 [Macrostomum lignano]|uniref:Apolipoprotein L3 n=2 Tax=Macrostomum lignano TaxID=282301 RepID=A0A267F2W1_9PLAT|nr:hypothetical protein BOX15_Mlig024591g2 [Macrostomum lignano]
MQPSEDQKKSIAAAAKIAEELMAKLVPWITERKEVVSRLKEIADEIDKIEKDVNISKTVGTSVSILGGVASIAAIVATGGLAAPLIAGSVAVAGAATSGGASITGDLLSNNKMKQAQAAMDQDKRSVGEIETLHRKLDARAVQLSKQFNVEPEAVTGLFLMSSMGGRQPYSGMLGNLLPLTLACSTIITVRTVLTTTVRTTGKGITKAVGQVSTKALTRTVGSVLGAAVASALIVWDVVELVKTAKDMEGGSKTDAAGKLRQIATELESEVHSLEAQLEEARKKAQECSEWLGRMEHVRKLFETLSKIGEKRRASSEDARDAQQALEQLTDETWRLTFLQYVPQMKDRVEFTSRLARLYQLFSRKIPAEPPSNVTVTILSHGGIDPRLQLPVGFHFPIGISSITRGELQKIALYSPWGCSINASVTCGIITDTLSMRNVQFDRPVYAFNAVQGHREARPSGWNELHRSSGGMIPSVTFTPLQLSDQAVVSLREMLNVRMPEFDSVVVPYFTFGDNAWPFPTVTLFEVSVMLNLLGFFRNMRISLQVACCLDWPGRDEVVPCEQYYVTGTNTMRNRNAPGGGRFHHLDGFL